MLPGLRATLLENEKGASRRLSCVDGHGFGSPPRVCGAKKKPLALIRPAAAAPVLAALPRETRPSWAQIARRARQPDRRRAAPGRS